MFLSPSFNNQEKEFFSNPFEAVSTFIDDNCYLAYLDENCNSSSQHCLTLLKISLHVA